MYVGLGKPLSCEPIDPVDDYTLSYYCTCCLYILNYYFGHSQGSSYTLKDNEDFKVNCEVTMGGGQMYRIAKSPWLGKNIFF